MLKKVPDAMVIVAAILLLFVGLTWVIPAGEYERVEKAGKMAVVPGTYEQVEAQPQSIWSFFTAPIKGFVAAADVIAFVLLIGGAFYILQATGAIDAGLQRLITYAYEHPRVKPFIIPMLMTFFSVAGATFGMSEEVLVFILITLPLSYSLGYDAIVGVAIPFVGAGLGFAGAILNPFTVGIAQGIAELPPFSGWQYRLIVWLVFTAVGTAFVMWYAHRIEKKPERSLMHGRGGKGSDEDLKEAEDLPFGWQRKLVLGIFVLTLGLLVYGVSEWGWYIEEISGLFVAMGIAAAIVYRLPLDETVQALVKGAQEMMPAALIIGLSRGILVVAEEGRIIDTILHSVTGAVGDLPNYISVQFMLVLQTFVNFFIPSGSGQAAVTMPLMTPLSDLLGISRQTAVLAYQFGDGITNLIIPTSGITMGILAIAKIPYEVWLKWIWKLILVLYLLSMFFLALPTTVVSWN